MKVYKIRRKSDGLFATAGLYGGFNKKGKAWATIGALKLHLNLFNKREIEYKFHDCEIVEFELQEIRTATIIDKLTKYKIDWNE